MYITIAWDLYQKKELGAQWGRDDLSEGEWACLFGISQGFIRAENAHFEQAKQKAQSQR